MAIIVTGTTGPQSYSGGGIQPAQGIRLARDGSVAVTEYNAPHYLAASDQRVFTAFASAVATSVVGTGMVGLQLWNGSTTVNLALLEVGGMIIVTSATVTSLVLAFGTGQVSAPTGQTAITKAACTFLSTTAPGPQALATNAGTFTNAPVAILNLMHNTAAIATTGEDSGFRVDLKGRYIVPPQSYVAIAAVGAAVAASGSNLDLSWMEVPV
jgi:hypothetical protein